MESLQNIQIPQMVVKYASEAQKTSPIDKEYQGGHEQPPVLVNALVQAGHVLNSADMVMTTLYAF
jgi:hypothetical protein